jgi:hypothetical protein
MTLISEVVKRNMTFSCRIFFLVIIRDSKPALKAYCEVVVVM